MNELLLKLLSAQLQSQNNNENPLAKLLSGQQSNQQDTLMQLLNGGQQNPQQQLLNMLSGGQQNNQQVDLLKLLSGNQQPDVNQQLLALLAGGSQPNSQPDVNTQLLQLLSGSQSQHTEQPDVTKLLELLKSSGDVLNVSKDTKEKSIIEQLEERQLNKQTDAEKQKALEDLIRLEMTFDKFVDENESSFPDFFNIADIRTAVDKWAKNTDEKTQGITAAIAQAFFKNEANVDVLEEKDRLWVKKNIVDASERSINRDETWPVVQRAVFNKTRLAEGDNQSSGGKGDSVIEKYEQRFSQGENVSGAAE
ncbi:hypothetical protein [Photobacterium indicum]|uniref:Uncharacterized protein n=1 Tax=Photobacterium indicum TaxID=81447 RepID=A0A2T3LFA7_9GAMM|nr:hypothetical protein [Photobacterium indicum]PSV50028.1 hypothetical protein C9J47_05620 [Photobacterium indicum]